MSSGGMELAVLVLMLTGLMSGGQDAAQDGFAYEAVLQANDLTLSVDSMMEVLVGPSNEKIDEMIERLGSDDFETREKAYDAIVDLGPGAIPKLEARLRNSQDMDVRMRCKKAIEDMTMNKARYLQVRRAALAGLAHLDAKDKIELIAKYLDDEDAGVRGEAATALAKLGGDKALAILKERVEVSVKTGKVDTPEIMLAYIPHASNDELKAMGALLGVASRKIDLCLLGAYSERMGLEEWLGMVRKYVAASNETPPSFIRELLIDVYGLKDDPRYNWLAFDETFPWAAFCKKGGTLRNIDEAQATALRKGFAEGLAGADRAFLMHECLRAVPASAIFVAGTDIEQLHRLGMIQDFIQYAGDDPILNFALQKAVESSGAFQTDCVIFYFDPQGFSGREIGAGFIARGKYNSVRQTEAFAAMLGWEKRIHNGVTYLRSQDEDSYGPEIGSICFYNDQYVLVGLESEYSTSMEGMIDRLTSDVSSILMDKEAMTMLNAQTLSASAWAMARPGNLGQIFMQMISRFEERGEEELDVEEMAQLALFGNKDSVATATFDKDGLTLKLRARYSDTEYARRIHGYLGKMRDTAIQGLEMALGKDSNNNALPPLRMIHEMLKGATYRQDGAAIEIEAKMNMAQLREITRALYLPMFSASMAKEMRKMYTKEQRFQAQKKAVVAEIDFRTKAVQKIDEQNDALAKEETELNARPDSAEKKSRLDDIKIEKMKLASQRESIEHNISDLKEELAEVDKKIQKLAEQGDTPDDEDDEKYDDEEYYEGEKKDVPEAGGGFSEDSPSAPPVKPDSDKETPAEKDTESSKSDSDESIEKSPEETEIIVMKDEDMALLEKMMKDNDARIVVFVGKKSDYFKDEESARKQYPNLDKMLKKTTKNGFIVYFDMDKIEGGENLKPAPEETPEDAPAEPPPVRPEG